MHPDCTIGLDQIFNQCGLVLCSLVSHCLLSPLLLCVKFHLLTPDHTRLQGFTMLLDQRQHCNDVFDRNASPSYRYIKQKSGRNHQVGSKHPCLLSESSFLSPTEILRAVAEANPEEHQLAGPNPLKLTDK